MQNQARHWTAADIPDQHGRTAIVTGANSGIGYETALELARKGAEVILACRNADKGGVARDRVLKDVPDAHVRMMALDLASLASVRAFSAAFTASATRLDLLINNAGIMAIPFRTTEDGFEMQFGVNHLGHFALTGLLLPLLLKTPAARVVNVSSGVHMWGDLNLKAARSAEGYSPRKAYSQSKLANLLFTYELQRRLEHVHADVISVGCHPGWAATNLQAVGPRMSGSRFRERVSEIANSLLAQTAAMGALPTLYAATAPGLRGGEYVGPSGMGGMRGYPIVTKSSTRSHDLALAEALWIESEALTGVRFEALAPQPA